MTKTSMVWDELPMTGKFGAVINPGDKCWTFTGVYGGSAIAVNSGIFRGIRTVLTHGIEIEVVNNVEGEKEDIIQDFISVITSFSARIYGQRRSKRKTEQLIKQLETPE